MSSDHHDFSWARTHAAYALVALLFVAITYQAVTGMEVVDIYKLIAILTAVCTLVGINRVRLGGL